MSSNLAKEVVRISTSWNGDAVITSGNSKCGEARCLEETGVPSVNVEK
jgi:hypothetical protein